MTHLSKARTKVLLVDDSSLSRKLCRRMLERYRDIEIVGEAEHPYRAIELMAQRVRPDVIVLDLEMPKMNGLTFLKLLMRTSPTPIVIFSSIAQPNSKALVEALAAGAIDVVSKPSSAGEFGAVGRRLHQAIGIAAGARFPRQPRQQPPAEVSPVSIPLQRDVGVIALGASTGGPQALQLILPALAENSPPILLVQHMPTTLTPAFVSWLDDLSPHRTIEATDRGRLLPGAICVGSGGRHLRLERANGEFVSRLSDAPAGGLHRPSVDVLFESVAHAAGSSAVGVILSGMGRDGAKGLLAMRNAGAHTIAQDQASCVVNGMPGESRRLGAVSEVVPLENVSDRITRISRGELRHVRT